MRRAVLMIGVVCGLFGLAVPAEAQLCVGAPSFQQRPFAAALTAPFTDGAHGVSGQFGAGGELLFAGGSVGFLNYSEADTTATSIRAFGGAEWGTSVNDRIVVCPLGQLGFTTGPDFAGVEVSSFDIEGGGSVGFIVMETDELTVVPNFGLSLIYTRTSADAAGVETSSGDGWGRATAGVGFIFNQNVGISTSIGVPFSVPGSDPVFSIRLTYGFGN